MSETLRVPLRGKGGKIKAWMLIDRADEGLVGKPWLTKGGYAMKIETARLNDHTLLHLREKLRAAGYAPRGVQESAWKRQGVA